MPPQDPKDSPATAEQLRKAVILDLHHRERITAEQAVLLMQLRRELAWARLRWWQKLGRVVWRVLSSERA